MNRKRAVKVRSRSREFSEQQHRCQANSDVKRTVAASQRTSSRRMANQKRVKALEGIPPRTPRNPAKKATPRVRRRPSKSQATSRNLVKVKVIHSKGRVKAKGNRPTNLAKVKSPASRDKDRENKNSLKARDNRRANSPAASNNPVVNNKRRVKTVSAAAAAMVARF